MSATPFFDLLHRVNNLLGTIEIQRAVAEASGTLEAHREALRLIGESAARAAAELPELKRRAQRAGD